MWHFAQRYGPLLVFGVPLVATRAVFVEG